MNLRSELEHLADTAPRPSIDSTLWDQGRALRRRDRLVTSAVVLALVVIVGGLVSLVVGPPRAFEPADNTVPGGAIPNRVVEPPVMIDPPLEANLGIGRASAAFFSAGGVPVIIGATDGRYHLVKLTGTEDRRAALELSPDGRRLAWSSDDSGVSVADLTTGDVTDLRRQIGTDDVVVTLSWRADSTHLTWANQTRGGIVDVVTGEAEQASMTDPFIFGSVSPDGELAAVIGRRGPAALFAAVGSSGTRLRRALPVDLYPKGTNVVPLGWAEDHLLLAEVFGPKGSYVEGSHLVLLTSPDRPESEWTFRIVMRDQPVSDLSIAVDLIPDLDGTSSQQLTHDFGEPDWPGQRDISWIIGLGVAAAVAVLLGLRWLWRRRVQLR